jgi:Ni/Co efflux regulator RcnB
MRKYAIRLLTLAIYATALVAVPMVTSAKAAADGKEMTHKKKHHRSSRIEEPRSSTQAPYANPNDNPDRKVSY